MLALESPYTHTHTSIYANIPNVEKLSKAHTRIRTEMNPILLPYFGCLQCVAVVSVRGTCAHFTVVQLTCVLMSRLWGSEHSYMLTYIVCTYVCGVYS